MSIRRKARELALQCLYQIDQSGNRDIDIEQMGGHFDVMKKAVPYAQELVDGILQHMVDLDAVIEGHAKNWRLSRMAVIDRNLLRLAAYELMHQHDTPASVIINEVLEIAKRYSTDEAAPFINGILDPLAKSVRQDS